MERPEGSSSSRINRKHAELAVTIIEKIISEEKHAKIGFVTPYRLQADEVERLLAQRGIHEVECGTVHRYQGREKDYIIYDTVEGFFDTPQLRPYVEFSFEKRLINVALTRTRKLVFIICNRCAVMSYLQKCKNESVCRDFFSVFNFQSSRDFRRYFLKPP